MTSTHARASRRIEDGAWRRSPIRAARARCTRQKLLWPPSNASRRALLRAHVQKDRSKTPLVRGKEGFARKSSVSLSDPRRPPPRRGGLFPFAPSHFLLSLPQMMRTAKPGEIERRRAEGAAHTTTSAELAEALGLSPSSVKTWKQLLDVRCSQETACPVGAPLCAADTHGLLH